MGTSYLYRIFKFNNYFTQFLLVILNIIIYTFSFNFYISVSLVTAIILHELGHFCAAKKLKLTVQGCYLIPYVGGALIISDKYQSYKQQLILAISGPLSGSLSAILTLVLYIFYKNLYLGTFLYITVIINLCNLLPMSFLDGGQIIESFFSFYSEKLGLYWKIISSIIISFMLWQINKIICIATVLLFYPNIRHSYLKILENKSSSLEKLDKYDAAMAISAYLIIILLLAMILYFLITEGSVI